MPDDIRLVLPRTDVRRSYNEASAELRDAFGPDTSWPGNRVMPGVEFTDDELLSAEGFERFVLALHQAADPGLPVGAGWVHSTMLWLIDFAPDAPRYLGRLSLRHELNGFLRTEGGHIGYVIRPSAQRRGLGTRMLAMAMPATAARGIERALVTCDSDNVGSAKVIIGNGGVEDTPYRTKRRFWVPSRPRLADIQPDLVGVLAAQLAILRTWITKLPAADYARPSVLAGWTVGDLIAHVARSGNAVLQLQPTDAAPLRLGEYVSAYAAAADEIAAGTRAPAVETAGDRIGTIDASWSAAMTALADLGTGDRVVAAPRGPILLSEFVVTRLIELVVHADDLGRSVGRTGPQDLRAVDVVTAALVQVWADRYPGVPIPPADDDLDWIRKACGRIRSTAAELGLPLL
jgi:uncharacterized protein (TIGR03083 family)